MIAVANSYLWKFMKVKVLAVSVYRGHMNTTDFSAKGLMNRESARYSK